MTEPHDTQSTGNASFNPQARPPIDPTGAMLPPSPPPASGAPGGYYGLPPYAPPPPKRSWIKRLAYGLVSTMVALLLMSLMINVYLGAFFVSVTQSPHELTYHEGDGQWDQRVTIVPVIGMIDGDTSEFVRRAIAKLRQDQPKAIVLRVDSGGGGVTASDQIWHELKTFLEDTENKIPLVSSFGTMAASGGYYVSMPTQHIFVEPTTLTGSIGVIANAFTFHELLDKIGVTPEVITATEATKKDGHNPMLPWTDYDRTSLRFILDQAHARFTKIVDEGRPDLDFEQVRKLATGEIFTAQQALDLKLADQEGYLDQAIEKAKELAGLSADADSMVTILKPPHQWGFGGVSTPPGFPGSTTASQSDTGTVSGIVNGFQHALSAGNSLDSQTVRRWINELAVPQIEYRVTP